MKSAFAGMKNSLTNRFAIVVILVAAFAAVPLLSRAHSASTANITIVNNFGREVRHIYFSSPNDDNWGSDQLNNSVIPSGGSFSINGAACNGVDVKVVAEDQDGCFLYQVVACSGSVTWTIANDATPDCGN